MKLSKSAMDLHHEVNVVIQTLMADDIKITYEQALKLCELALIKENNVATWHMGQMLTDLRGMLGRL
jgi:hypothetical protein